MPLVPLLLSSLFGKPPMADQTEAILGRHLDGDFCIFPMAEGRTSASQVAAVASRLGVTFPPELVAHLSGRFPGMLVEAREEVWPRPKALDTGPFWTFLYTLHSYTAADTSEDWMRLEVAGAKFQQETGLPVVPVLRRAGDANCYCIDRTGAISEFDHETGTLEPVGMGFFELFEKEVRELAERAVRRKRYVPPG